jgi:hypothetical protein
LNAQLFYFAHEDGSSPVFIGAGGKEMILFQPYSFSVEIDRKQGSETFIEGDDILVPGNGNRLPVPPQGGFSFFDFLQGKCRPELNIQESPAGTLPYFLLQRKTLVAFYAGQPIQ